MDDQRAESQPAVELTIDTSDERVLDVRFDEASLIVDLMDGRTIAVPLAWVASVRGITAGRVARASAGCCFSTVDGPKNS